MPDPIPESSGRNPQRYGVGASNDTARRDYSCQRTDRLIEAVVGRENMFRAYNRVVRNKGAAGVDAMNDRLCIDGRVLVQVVGGLGFCMVCQGLI